MKGRLGHTICATHVQQSMNVAKAGSKPTSFSFSPECLLFSFTLSTLTNDNNEIRKSLLAVFIISELMAGAALTVVTRSNDL